ncbi:hypothetical protein [Victivallis sp. Marseille-Q1083]|uniref:hypothetical protein n=1 Tax=Victivallis sp. Marseille-Q1083 TaxID=2717288 RepID=UPI001589FC8A|nr:hypothetical protein [Victivallis sp. Marseille-Q1083]
MKEFVCNGNEYSRFFQKINQPRREWPGNFALAGQSGETAKRKNERNFAVVRFGPVDNQMVEGIVLSVVGHRLYGLSGLQAEAHFGTQAQALREERAKLRGN